MTTRDDMLAKLTELSAKVADEVAQEKVASSATAEVIAGLQVKVADVLASSTEVITGLKAKVAELELAALPAADFSDELAQIAAIEASIGSIAAPTPVAPPAPVVVPPADPIVPPVVLPVV